MRARYAFRVGQVVWIFILKDYAAVGKSNFAKEPGGKVTELKKHWKHAQSMASAARIMYEGLLSFH